LEYAEDKNTFTRVHQETFGKSGCRRIVPGQYVSVDPKGRAVMLAAVEKQKLVYVLNRDANNRLTISSPLEANKSHTVTFAMSALDVGFENPIFACLEMDHQEADQDSTGAATLAAEKVCSLFCFRV
jgi:splicing factor 3B subunit 3